MSALPAQAQVTPTTIATNGSWQARRAFGAGVYNPVVNKTVVGWNGNNSSIYLREYDHATNQWGSQTFLWTPIEKNYHNYSTIIRAPDGHYLVFYFRHNLTSYVLRSPSPNSIAGTWTHSYINSQKNVYPMPVTVGNTVYLFYSRNAGPNWSANYRTYAYVKSTDNGVTWSTQKTVIDTQQQHGYDEVYLHGYSYDAVTNRILLGWEMHGGPGGHNSGGKNAYFAYFDCDDEKMYSAAGTDLGVTINNSEMVANCLVDTGVSEDSIPFGYTVFPEVLPNGNPAVAYRLEGTNYISQWTGTAWSRSALSIADTVQDYQIRHDGKYVLLTASTSTVRVYESTNGVSGWTQVWQSTVAYSNGANRSGVTFIEDFRAGVQVLNCTSDTAVRSTDYTGKWPIIAYGDAGAPPPPTLPTAPSALAASAVSSTQINLAWTDNSSNETGFKIERQTGGGNFIEIASVGANVVTYNNTGLTASTAYTYRVRAYNGVGNSAYSGNSSATTQSGTPPADPYGGLPVSQVSASAHDGNVPANVLDRNLSTRWSAEGVGQWLTLDLGSEHTIDSVGISWFLGDQRQSYFSIAVSTNGTSWQTVLTGGTSSGATLEMEEHTFSPVAARYVRIIGGGNSNSAWNSITEARVFAADSQTQYEVPAEADSSVRSGSFGTINYGTNINLEVKKANHADYTRESYLRFDVSFLTEAVTSATVELIPYGVGNSGQTNAAYAVANNAWGETTITYNTRPSTGATLATWTVVQGVPVEIDVTDLIEAARTGDGKVTICLKSTTTQVDGQEWVNYGSREGTLEDRPVLIVE